MVNSTINTISKKYSLHERIILIAYIYAPPDCLSILGMINDSFNLCDFQYYFFKQINYSVVFTFSAFAPSPSQ